MIYLKERFAKALTKKFAKVVGQTHLGDYGRRKINMENVKIFRTKIRILSDDMAQVKASVEVVGKIGDKLFSDEIKVHINSLYITTKQRDEMIKLMAIKEFKQLYGDKETSPTRTYTMKFMRQHPHHPLY